MVLGSVVSITPRVCLGFRHWITLAPVWVVVSVASMVVLGQCRELAIRLIMFWEHPELLNSGRWIVLDVNEPLIILMLGLPLLTLNLKLSNLTWL